MAIKLETIKSLQMDHFWRLRYDVLSTSNRTDLKGGQMSLTITQLRSATESDLSAILAYDRHQSAQFETPPARLAEIEREMRDITRELTRRIDADLAEIGVRLELSDAVDFGLDPAYL